MSGPAGKEHCPSNPNLGRHPGRQRLQWDPRPREGFPLVVPRGPEPPCHLSTYQKLTLSVPILSPFSPFTGGRVGRRQVDHPDSERNTRKDDFSGRRECKRRTRVLRFLSRDPVPLSTPFSGLDDGIKGRDPRRSGVGTGRYRKGECRTGECRRQSNVSGTGGPVNDEN